MKNDSEFRIRKRLRFATDEEGQRFQEILPSPPPPSHTKFLKKVRKERKMKYRFMTDACDSSDC